MGKPKNLTELQSLTDYILKAIGDKGKIKVKLNPRLERCHALAHIQHYIKTGFRNVTMSQNYFENYTLEELIDTIIHEIAHFKYNRTRKLRKLYLKSKKDNLDYSHTPEFRKLLHSHNHTKAFYRLVDKLKARYEQYGEAN